MTRKEKEEQLLNALGLKVGDLVELTFSNDNRHLYRIIETDQTFALKKEEDEPTVRIIALVEVDFQKVEKPRKWKDIKCKEKTFTCSECPIQNACCRNEAGETLQEALDNAKKVGLIDEEEYSFYQKRIDKEYKETEQK